MSKNITIIDGNEARPNVAPQDQRDLRDLSHHPFSNMGEWADQWSSEGRKNIWGTIPLVAELQSEAARAARCMAALQTGALTTNHSRPRRACC
jgi:pyruvate-ferredoxin/flavodoxin oxidoreductase